jgi:hypothetical protein
MSTTDAKQIVETATNAVIDAVREPSWNHAFVKFNNQDSVLMSMSIPDDELLGLLHDNRIFAFNKSQAGDDASSSSNEQNVILDLLTTAKYRAMSAMYLIFRLLDNSSLLLIFILSIIDIDDLQKSFIPASDDIALLSTIGLEVFYDVMLYTHKYWILQRLSIHIGFVLYIFYPLIVVWKSSNGDYKPHELQNVIIALSVRFSAFIFEECVDIAIDGVLNNDLLKLQNQSDQEVRVDPERDVEQNEDQPLLEKITSLFSWSKFKKFMDVSNDFEMPQNVDYVGSFFAWSPKSVFTRDVWGRNQFPFWLICILCFVPFIVAVILLFFIIVLCLLAFSIPVTLAYVFAAIRHRTCKWRILEEKVRSSNFWKELTHF